ncbi:MAG: YDG domain-containing protein, partial [Sphaerochaeta sp.]|nr:YDG domain-containing protein [Sphaerochaeta sp.]
PDSYLTTSGEITKKALTVSTSVDTQIVPSKTYDGTPSARVTRDGNPAGVVGSEQVALVATAVYNSQTVGTGKTISVTYALTGDHAGNYTAPAGYALSTTGVAITTKQLSVAAGTTQITAEKLFDETNVAEVIEPGTLDGVVGNDLVILGATAFYNNETIGTGKAITVVYSLTGADSGNYAAPDRNGTSFTGSISRGQLTISDPSLVKTKIYNSADDCIVFPSNSVQGIVGSDVVQVEAKATFADKHVGANKKITVVYSLSGKDALKYTKPVDYVTHDGEIQHKELIISAPTGFTTSKPYDGNASVAFTPGTVSGRYDGDSVNVVANGFYLSPTVANDKRIFFTYTLSGPDAANYIRPSYDVIENAEITKKVLTVQAGTTVIVSEKTYNKTADAVVTRPGMLDGLVVGSEDVSLSATASYLNANAGEVKDIVVTYSISGRDAVKYTAPAPLTIRDGTINRLLLTIADPSFPAGKDRAYNGSTTLDVTAGDLIGLLDEGITVSAAANYGGKDASPTPWTITVAYTLGGTGSDNYLKPVDTTVLGTIDKKQLAIYSQNLTTSKAYDGNATAVISHVALAGIVSNEDVSILSSTATYDTEGVGTGKTITVSYVLGGSHAGNYLEPLDTTAVGAIDRKQLTIYSQNLTTNRDYDGTAAAAISGVTLSGIVLSENVVVNPTATYDTKDQGTGKNITVSYALSGTHAGNYLKPIDNMFVGTVNRKQLTVASQNLSTNRDYDGTAAAAISGVTLSGIMLSENVVVNPTATYDTKNQGAGKTITLTYPLSGTDIGNYLQPNTTTIGGTINRKQLTVSSQNLTINKVYDGTATAAISGVVLSGFVHSENVVVNPTATYNSKDVSTANKITVIYPISGTDIGNYLQPGNTAVEGAISQKQLAIASQNLTTSKAYNGNANAAISGVTLDGVISGDRVTVSATATYDSMEIGTGKTITVSYALGDSHAGNYLKPADTTFTGAISQRMVAVSGTITDSSTGYGLGGVVVSASGLPDTTTTNTSGYFSMTIPSGARTLHFSHADYNLASINIPDNGGTSFQIPQNAIIGNKLLPEGQLRMVLTWGSSPSDLDFYLRTPSSGTVYYGTKTVEGANLDVDDTSSYGPETITITSIQNGTYSCYVHNYSGGSFSYSEATVRLYDRTGLIRTFTVPTSGPGLYWNVFTYTNGTITTVNQVSSSPI